MFTISKLMFGSQTKLHYFDFTSRKFFRSNKKNYGKTPQVKKECQYWNTSNFFNTRKHITVEVSSTKTRTSIHHQQTLNNTSWLQIYINFINVRWISKYHFPSVFGIYHCPEIQNLNDNKIFHFCITINCKI